MTPESYQFLNDWILHILAGVLLAAFAYLTGQRRAEKVSMGKTDCVTARASCLELQKVSKEGDEKVYDQKLFRLEEKITSVEEKIDNICGKMDSLRGMVLDYFKSQGFKERRRNLDPERDDVDVS